MLGPRTCRNQDDFAEITLYSKDITAPVDFEGTSLLVLRCPNSTFGVTRDVSFSLVKAIYWMNVAGRGATRIFSRGGGGASRNLHTVQWPVGCEKSTLRRLITMLRASSVLSYSKKL